MKRKLPKPTVGSKYEATKRLDIKEVAKLVRADIKQAIKDDVLPKGKFRVNIRRYTGGQSMDIFIPKEHCGPYPDGKLHKGRRIAGVLYDIGNAYNYDDSDPMSDYHCAKFILFVQSPEYTIL